MKAIFTKQAIKEFNLPGEWLVLAIELEEFKTKIHYSIKVSCRKWLNIGIDYYYIEYIENSKEILDYFLNRNY